MMNGKGAIRTGIGMLAAICLLALPLRAHAQCAPPSEGLIGHWTLDETTGTAITDRTGNNNLTWSGSGAVAPGNGMLDGALVFDGIDDYAFKTPQSGLHNSEYTISAWTKTSATDVTAADVVNVGNNYVLRISTSGLATLVEYDGSVWDWAQGTTNILDGVWHHITAVKSATTLAIYIDGAREHSVSDTDPTVYAWGNDIQIGRHPSGDRDFNGEIDDVRIYNRALSDSEIAALYATRSTADAPAGFMAYDHKSDAMVYCNGTDWVHAGIGSYSPNAVRFDGATELTNASMAGNASVDTDKYTASFWIKPRTGMTEAYDTIWEGASTGRIQIAVEDEGTPGNGVVQISYGGRNSSDASVAQVGSNNLTTGSWYHVLLSVDAGNNIAHLYINDVQNEQWNVITPANGNFDFNNQHSVSANGGELESDLADFWLDVGTYIDFSVEANRRKFRSPSGLPMYLGADGSIPTGRAPDIFMTGATSDWHTNKGTGGGFTVSGALTTAAAQPATCTPGSGPLSLSGSYALTDISYDGVWHDGQYTYVTRDGASGGGLYALTFDGSSFSVVDIYTTGLATGTPHIIGDGRYLYVVDWDLGMQAFTFNGQNFSPVGTSYGNFEPIWTDGTYIFNAKWSTDQLSVFSFDGSTFTVVDTIASNDVLSGDTVGEYVFTANRTSGISAYRFADGNLSLVASQDTPDDAWDVWSDGRYVFVADFSGVLAYAFDGNSFSLVDSYASSGNAMNIWSDSDHIFVGDQWTGFLALKFDGSGFSAPSTIATTGDASRIIGDGTYLYGVDKGGFLRAYGGYAGCNCGLTNKGLLTAEGQVNYDTSYNVMQYCNGAEWVAMGPVGGTPPTSGLIGHWKLDESAGTTAVDSVAGTYNGTLSGTGNSTWKPSGGVIDGALSFDGTWRYVSVADTNALNGSDNFSVSAWVKFAASTPSQTILEKGHSASPWGSWALDYAATSKFQFQVVNNSGTWLGVTNANTPLVTGQWYHFVGVKEGAYIKLFVNGALDKEASNFTGTVFSSDGDMTIGGNGNDLNGDIDDVRFYSRALSDSEIRQLYQYGLSGGLGDVDNACASPAAEEGEMLYAIDHNYMQYCNGENWVAIGK